MKTLYVTNDGKEFDDKAKAVEYEAKLNNNDDKKKAIMAQIEANKKAIYDIKDEATAKIEKLLDENDRLLDECKKYLDPETREQIDLVDKFLNMLFGDNDDK